MTAHLESPRTKKYLFVASTGGHLAQLDILSKRLNHQDDSLWVTFRTPQSESILRDRRVKYIPYIRPRDVAGVAHGFFEILSLLRTEPFDEVISTGAGIALSAFPAARIRRVASTYVESVSRTEGPSLSGKVIATTRMARTFTQHEAWASRRWPLTKPVLGLYRSARPADYTLADHPLRIFTTLGTIEGYRFDSLVDQVLAISSPDDQLAWQLGCTHRDALPGDACTQMSAAEFEDQARRADVVITHAGVGTIMKLLEMGVYPVVVPRAKERHEHVDDHQHQITDLVARLNLGVTREAGELCRQDLLHASGMRVECVAPGAN